MSVRRHVFEGLFTSHTSGASKRTTILESVHRFWLIPDVYTETIHLQKLHISRDILLDICSYVVDLYMVLFAFLMCVIEKKVIFSFVTNVEVLGLFVHV